MSSPTETYDAHHVSHLQTSHDSPLGHLDSAQRVSGGIRVQGWTIDPDTGLNVPNSVHVYVDITGYNIGNASLNRPDVAAVYPNWGSNHGFNTVVAVGSGPNTVCAYGINVGAGANASLGCIVVP